jgi:uncharacterized protein YeaO (DUF488 family)
MLRQATVKDISNRRITRRHGRIVVVTHYYPRYLKRPLIDEYEKRLAPTRELLEEFKSKEEAIGDHDQAFELVDYEKQFILSAGGLSELQRLAEEARGSEIYLVCHCSVGARCHREILMVLARDLYGAPIARLSFPWEKIRSRLSEFRRVGNEE